MNRTFIDELKTSLQTTYDIQTLCQQFIVYGNDVMKHSIETTKTRTSHLKQFMLFCNAVGVTDIRDVHRVFLDAYFIEFAKTRKESTLNTDKRIIKVFIQWLEEYKELNLLVKSASIHSVRKKDNTPKAIDTFLIAQVIAKANEQDSLLVATAYEAALRISELINLKVCDIDYDSITVIGKGSNERTVLITVELASALQDFITKYDRQANDYVFQKRAEWGGGRYGDDTLRQRIKNCFMNIAGLEMYPHQLRHTFAITLLNNGCDIVTIQRLLGHKDINTTMIYLRVSDKFIKEKYSKFMGKSLLLHKRIDI